MPTAELTDTGLDGHNSPRGRIDVAPSWAPPISPMEPAADGDPYLGEETFDTAPPDEHLFQTAERSDIYEILMGFGLQQKLIAGGAVVATLAVGILACLFWPAADEKTKTETATAASAVESEPEITGHAAPRIPERSLSAPTAVALSALPSSGHIGSSSQVAATAPVGNAETRHAPATQNQNIAFLQRPGVKIRSTPATNGPVVGTAPKGTRFKVSKRDGDWIQVESDRLKGWINSQFLGPNNPH
jgi:hypothetical protein